MRFTINFVGDFYCIFTSIVDRCSQKRRVLVTDLWHRERRTLILLNTECVGSLTSHSQLLMLWERTYDLSSLSDKSRKSNHLQMPSHHCANPDLLDYTL